MSITVIIGDDHPVVREGLKSMILTKGSSIEVIGEAER